MIVITTQCKLVLPACTNEIVNVEVKNEFGISSSVCFKLSISTKTILPLVLQVPANPAFVLLVCQIQLI